MRAIFFRRTRARTELGLVLPVVALLTIYFGMLAGPHHPASPDIYALEWGTVSSKIHRLGAEFLRYGGRTYRPMLALLAFCLLWPVRRQLAVPRRLLAPAVLEQIALAATFLGVYIVLPGTYSWRFRYDPHEHDWQPAVLAPVSWGEVACEYPYIIATEPFVSAYIEVPTRTVAANSSAALLAVNRGACRPGSNTAAGVTRPERQVTY